MAWKLLGKKTALKTFRSSVESWRIQLPNNKERDFFINAGYSFVMVFALDIKGKVIILKQHYISQQKKLISLVAGIIDEGESPKNTAQRELMEEAGYKAKKVISLGKSIKGKYSTGTIYHFLALDAVKLNEPNLEEAEDIQISTISLSDFKKLLDQNKMPDAFAEICARRALKYLKK